MSKEFVLPISSKPSIISYIHYAYPCAIIESKELASISIDNLEKHNWQKRETNCSLSFNNENVDVFEAEPNYAAETVIWRKFDQLDEICVQINYLKARDYSRYIDLFLFKDELEAELKKEDKSCGVRWNPYGYFIGKEMHDFNTGYYDCVKLRKSKKVISVFASRNKSKWKLVGHISLPKKYSGEKLNIGVHLYFGVDYFERWKYSNFIQLIYNKDNPYKGVNLDYYFFPRKNIDNSYLCFINYLDTHYDSLFDALDAFKTIKDYICWNIKHSYYLNICLDEYYVPERGNYNKHHYDHYNLIYGFDDEKRVYYAMGYGVNSTPVLSKIPYEIVNEDGIKSSIIVRYKYKINEIAKYKFCIEKVRGSIEDFLFNMNSSLKHSNILTSENLLYGLDVIKYIGENEIALVKADKRIAFCLAEHAKIMRDRIDYLYENKYLTYEDYTNVKSHTNEAVHISSVILGLVMKNKMVSICDDRFRDKLLSLYQEEKLLATELLNCLD